MGILTVCSLISSSSGETPRPSLPIATAQRLSRAPLISRVSARRAAAYRGRPDRDSSPGRASASSSYTGRRKQAPMVARTVLGEKGSAQWFTKTRPSAPSASAVRQMVPTLPGSWRPSRISQRSPVSRSGGVRTGILARNSTPWGLLVSHRLSRRSAGTSARHRPSSPGRSTPRAVTTPSMTVPAFSASASSLGPSPKKSPLLRRYSRSDVSLRMCLISRLLRLVIISKATPSFWTRFLYNKGIPHGCQG